MAQYDHIVNHASQPARNWSNKQVVQFHYFNKNGLYQQWKSMTDTITQYVDAGIVPSGWHLAYGSLNYYNTEMLTMDLHEKQLVNSIKLEVCLRGIQADIDRGYNRLAEELV